MSSSLRVIVNSLLLLGIVAALGLAVIGWRELADAAVWGRVLIAAGLGGAALISVSFLLPFELRANLTIAGVASLLALWAASWLLYEPERSRAELRHHQRYTTARKAGVDFDRRTPIEVIDDLRSEGVDAYPALSVWSLFTSNAPETSRLEDLPVIPLAGRSRTPTVQCNESGQYLIVDADRYGFNNPARVYASGAPVMLLGDSFAYGYCVQPGGDLAGHLRARDVDLVNLGYPGTGPLIQLAQLREYGPLVRPRIILWLYYHGNDLTNLRAEYEEPVLRRYLNPEHRQNLPDRQAEIDAFWAEWLDWDALREEAATKAGTSLMDILLLQPLRVRLRTFEREKPRPSDQSTQRRRPDPILDQFDEAIDGMIEEAEAQGARLYFVSLPTYGQFVGDGPPHREEVLTAVRRRGLPVIDFEKRLRETGDPLQYYPFREPGHFTDAGYALLAEQILENVPFTGVP